MELTCVWSNSLGGADGRGERRRGAFPTKFLLLLLDGFLPALPIYEVGKSCGWSCHQHCSECVRVKNDGFLPRAPYYICEKSCSWSCHQQCMKWAIVNEQLRRMRVSATTLSCHMLINEAIKNGYIYKSMEGARYLCFNVKTERQRTMIINWSLFWKQVIYTRVASAYTHIRDVVTINCLVQSRFLCDLHQHFAAASVKLSCLYQGIRNIYQIWFTCSSVGSSLEYTSGVSRCIMHTHIRSNGTHSIFYIQQVWWRGIMF